ncbi:MAG: SUMF1/EgtB/PvdO family nonheme iron enzyme [Albidovulum sp.]
MRLLAAALAVLVGIGGYYLGRRPETATGGAPETRPAAPAASARSGGASGGRVALVIGNAAYADRVLTNPVRDADAMAALLRDKLGFGVVIEEKDRKLSQMRAAVDRFLEAGKTADVRLFYYSGHGANYGGKSYLLPIDHGVSKGYQLPDQSYPLETLLRGLRDEAPGGVNLILLDACRNAPFGDAKSIWDNNKGLAPITKDAGTLIAYAAQPGKTASDNSGEGNSLFTKHLLAQLGRAEDLSALLIQVTGAVSAESRGEQLPEISISLTDPHLRLIDEPPPATTGTLAIRSSQPPGVAVYVDGALLGKAPQEMEGLPVGKAVTVTATQAGHEDYRERVWIQAGQRTELNVVLKPVAAPPPVATPATPAPPAEATPASVASAPAAELKPLQVFRDRLKDGSEGPALVVIPVGRFTMGSPKGEEERADDEQPHAVAVAVAVAGFAIGQYKVTFEEYNRFCAATKREKPSDEGWGRGRRPVINVDWNDAMAYAEWLSKATGQDYRLPTEAQWEYAARAGTTTPFWTGRCVTTDQANYDGNYGYGEPDCGAKTGVSRGKTVPVGSFKPNPWGLHDTMGNVWEWTCSAYTEEYGGAEQECADKGTAAALAVRGGGWDGRPAWVRSASRNWVEPAVRDYYRGFRLAKSL